MVALRSPHGLEQRPPEEPWPQPDPADWLTLQQAACELNISISTARRMVRRGFLRNRIVPRKGGFAYLIHLPGSRHARTLDGHRCGAGEPANVTPIRRVEIDTQPTPNGAHPHAADDDKDAQIHALQDQVDRLADALARALRVKQRALPPGMGEPDVNPHDPYARYRWLVRRARRGWWPF